MEWSFHTWPQAEDVLGTVPGNDLPTTGIGLLLVGFYFYLWALQVHAKILPWLLTFFLVSFPMSRLIEVL